MDDLDRYAAASEWALEKATFAAKDLDAPTPCEGWNVRTLVNHLLETQQYFVGAVRELHVEPPGQEPPDIVEGDPVAALLDARAQLLQAFGEPGVVERTGPLLGIAFADQLLHGWDLARAGGQDATMPAGLAEAAYGVIHGRFTEDQRAGTFGPELPVADGAPAQDRLLAYAGRDPSR